MAAVYIDMLCHTLGCLAIYLDALPYNEMPCHTLDALPYIGCLAIHLDALPYIGMPCHTMRCLAIQWYALPYIGMPCHTLICLAIHWDTLLLGTVAYASRPRVQIYSFAYASRSIHHSHYSYVSYYLVLTPVISLLTKPTPQGSYWLVYCSFVPQHVFLSFCSLFFQLAARACARYSFCYSYNVLIIILEKLVRYIQSSGLFQALMLYRLSLANSNTL